MRHPAGKHDQYGRLIHEPWAEDGERLDYYLARIRPDLGDQAFWEAECNANHVQVRDRFNLNTGTYDRTSWFIQWWDGTAWRKRSLATGERPRMRDGYCHIVNEG